MGCFVLFWKNEIWAATRTIVNTTGDGNQTVEINEGEMVEQSSDRDDGTSNLVSQDSSGPRLETGSVDPVFGETGEYTFHTYFSDPENREPEYVKIYIIETGPIEEVENIKPYLMEKKGERSQGIEYVYSKNISKEGQYQFFFEAKVGNTVLHNPYYGGQDCQPGLCPDCCGAWGGPKVLSENLISNHKVYLFDKNEKTAVWSYDVGENWVTDVDFSADGLKLAAVDNQGVLYVFDVSSNEPIWIFRAEFDRANGNVSGDRGLVDFSKDGLLTASLKGQVFLFDIKSSEPIWSHNIGMTLRGLNISDDGEYINAGGHDTKIYLWKTDSSIPLWEYQAKSEGGILGLEGSVIRAMAMSSDGKYFTAGTSCPDRSVYMFRPESSEPVYKIKAGENFPVENMAISNDGQYVIAVGGGGADDPYSAVLLETNKREVVWRFDYSQNPSISTAISDDGQSIAIGYILGGMYLVKKDSKNPVWQLKNPGYVADMVFAKDGESLVLGTGTYHVILVASDGSSILQDWKVGNKIETVAMSDNGQYVAAGTGLDRFMSIGGAKDRNTSGAGVGPLEDLGPELVKVAAGSKLESGFNPKTQVEIKNYFWAWVLGGVFLGVGAGGVVLLIKKGKIRMKSWRWRDLKRKT